MSDQERKKIANLHYPGMKVDPKDLAGGREPLSTEVKWRFDSQIATIGEDAQKTLFDSSILICSATALGVSLAKKLMLVGVGRVGIFGDEVILGSHQLAALDGSTSVLAQLSKWAKSECSWAQFESFKGETIERQFEDVVRGFQMILHTSSSGVDAARIFASARKFSIPMLFAGVEQRSGWYCYMQPDSTICENCLQLSKSTDHKLYFPTLEILADRIVDTVVENFTGASLNSLFMEKVESDHQKILFSQEVPKPLKNCGQCK